MPQQVGRLIKNIILYHHLRSPTLFWWYFYFMEEVWKDIKGYEDHYQISNLGRVKNLKFKRDRILIGGIDNHGYSMVILTKNNIQKTRKIHQLVAIAFLNHIPNKHKLVVNHKNFIRTDNRLINLEIVTQRENSNMKHIKSSSKYVGVTWVKSRNNWRSGITINGKSKFLGTFNNEYHAHLAYQKELKKVRNSFSL